VVDLIEALAHDHRELSELLVAVHEALARVERGQSTLDDELHEIRDGIEVFREELLEHSAREQEGLLPFVVARLPALRETADALIVEHDRIAEALTSVVKDLVVTDRDRGKSRASTDWRRGLSRFEEIYAAHTKSETAFLQKVVALLEGDREATGQLRALLEET
jgi:hemerythrin-like domain-containing protein